MNALDTVNQTRDAITVRRVYGEPYQADGVTIIPAAHVVGGGGGGGDALGNGGSGFGLRSPGRRVDHQGRRREVAPRSRPQPRDLHGSARWDRDVPLAAVDLHGVGEATLALSRRRSIA